MRTKIIVPAALAALLTLGAAACDDGPDSAEVQDVGSEQMSEDMTEEMTEEEMTDDMTEHMSDEEEMTEGDG